MNRTTGILLIGLGIFLGSNSQVFSQNKPPNQGYAIQLTIFDKIGNEPLEDTEIIVVETGTRSKTNALGIAKLQVPKLGNYTIKILGGEKIDTRFVDVRYANQNFIILANNESSGINVRSTKEKSLLSSYNLSQEEIKRVPGTQGDSLKAIQTLPGIMPGFPIGLTPTAQFNINITGQPYRNSDRGDFVLRGAGPRANQTYFDGLPVSYPFHLGNQSSVFNNNIISDLEVLTGAYSVRYGYATGGIINVTSKAKIIKPLKVWNINTFLSDAYIETPLWEGASMQAGVRKSYPNIFLLRAYPQGIPQDAKYADYQDYQFKFTTALPWNQTLSLTSLGARDLQAYTRSQAEFESNNGNADQRPPIGLDRRFETHGITHEWKFGDFIKHRIRASRNSFRELYEVRFTSPLTAETVFGLNNVSYQDLYFVENSLLFQFNKAFSIDVGGNYRERSIGLKADNITPRSSLFSDVFNNLINNNITFRALVDGDGAFTREKGGFAEFKYSHNNFLIIVGNRYDEYDKSRQKVNSPRGTIAYKFETTNTTLQAGTGIFRNAPIGIEQISSKSGNPNLGYETSTHSVIGIVQNFGKDWTIKLEGFKNIFNDLVVNDPYAINPYTLNNYPRDVLERTNSVRDNPIIPRNLNYSNRGYGYSDGFEVYIKKNPDMNRTSGWFGWISYTQSITKRNNNIPRLTDDDTRDRNRRNARKKLRYQEEIQEGYLNYYDDGSYEFIWNNDKAQYYDLDRTHLLNMVFGWKITSEWQVGGRFRYATGLPVTQIIGSDRVNQQATFGINLFTPKYSDQYNSFRLPSIHQLDIRIDKFSYYSWGVMNWYIDFINVYGRQNVSGQQFDNTRPFFRDNPTFAVDNLNSPYIQTVLPGGRIYLLPMIQFGLEVRF